jgi:hypothetical protein
MAENIVPHLLIRRHRGLPQSQLRGAVPLHPPEDRLEDPHLQVHQLPLPVDPGHLHVQRHVLVRVLRGLVLLRAVGAADLEHLSRPEATMACL